MGLFTRKDRPARPGFRETMAAADADHKRQQALLRDATDQIRTQADRERAVAELVAWKGEDKARKLIAGHARLQRRGWAR